MRINKLNLIITLLFLALPVISFGQQADYIWSPGLSYSWKSSDRWAYYTKVDLFNSLNEAGSSQFIQHVEPSLSFAYSWSVRTKIGGGYKYRLAEPFESGYQYEHRFLQQIGFISYFGERRISHRVRLEQRFRSSSYQNRLRYRLSYDLPLEGERLDPGEKYLILSNEMMTAFNADEADSENRALAGLGWYLNSRRKIELTLQYRTQDIFSDEGIEHLLRVGSVFYLNR